MSTAKSNLGCSCTPSIACTSRRAGIRSPSLRVPSRSDRTFRLKSRRSAPRRLPRSQASAPSSAMPPLIVGAGLSGTVSNERMKGSFWARASVAASIPTTTIAYSAERTTSPSEGGLLPAYNARGPRAEEFYRDMRWHAHSVASFSRSSASSGCARRRNRLHERRDVAELNHLRPDRDSGAEDPLVFLEDLGRPGRGVLHGRLGLLDEKASQRLRVRGHVDEAELFRGEVAFDRGVDLFASDRSERLAIALEVIGSAVEERIDGVSEASRVGLLPQTGVS